MLISFFRLLEKRADADDETVETKPSEASRAPETLTEAVKESTHSEAEYSQMETKPTEKK